MAHLDRLGAECLQFLKRCGGRLAGGGFEPHSSERIDQRHLARIAPCRHVPCPPATLHGMVDGSPPCLAVVGNEQLLVERVGYRRSDCGETYAAEPSAAFHRVLADYAEARFMIALGADVQGGV